MNRTFHLIRWDLRQVTRDPMLSLYLLAPLLLWVVLRFGVPVGAMLLEERTGFDLAAHYDLILSIALFLTPLILGVMTGFLMLDERDEKLIDYYAVTPLSKRGYLRYRLFLPVLLSVVYSVLLLTCSGLAPVRLWSMLTILPMAALSAPVMSLFLSAYASNKVEGMALSKGVGLLVFGPVIAYCIPFPMQALGAVFPAYWSSKAYFAGSASDLPAALLLSVTGTLYHILLFRMLLVRFIRKTD